MASLLATERDKASFPIEALTNVLDGGADRTARKRWIRSLVEKEAVFSNDGNNYMGRTERYKRALAKARRADELITQYGFEGNDAIILRTSVADDCPTQLHDLMFVPCLLSLCDQEQQAYWLPLARTKRVLGCYAQTEVGHGSNIRALQTTATYVPGEDCFVLNTPTVESFKWWPGTLGRTANTAMVIARLVLPGKDGRPQDLGIHNFIVPLRDLDTHELLPGVVTRDIGPKIGFNGMDNGCLELHNVKIPRTYMASRFNRIENGEYVKVPGSHPKAAYITMMQVRTFIVAHSARELSKACTIAVRYSAVRRQGYDESGASEVAVLDYQSQQFRLLPLVAASWAFHLTGFELLRVTAETERALTGGDAKAGDAMARLHAAAAGLKSLTTHLSAEGIEECRRCLGGHGFLLASGIPELYTTFLQQVTVEGENWLLTQQTASHLLKAYMRLATGRMALIDDCAYLMAAQSLVSNAEMRFTRGVRDGDDLQRLYGMRSFVLLERMAMKLQRLTEGEGLARMEAWNRVLIDAAAVSRAHSYFVLVRQFCKSVQAMEEGGVDGAVVSVLRKLMALFALTHIVRDAGDFLEAGLLMPDDMEEVRAGVEALLSELRPEAVGLVEAFDWTDFALKSALGRSDGDVYNALLESAKREPLNAKDPVDGFVQIYRGPQARL